MHIIGLHSRGLYTVRLMNRNVYHHNQYEQLQLPGNCSRTIYALYAKNSKQQLYISPIAIIKKH